jgi:hypothetical protein
MFDEDNSGEIDMQVLQEGRRKGPPFWLVCFELAFLD